MQQPFRNKGSLFSALALFGLILFFQSLMQKRPFDGPASESVAELLFSPLVFDAPGAGWALHGAWQITSEDARLAGLSGLARDGDELVAVTDYARVIPFAVPARGQVKRRSVIHNLTGSDGWTLRGRDAEAVAFAPDGSMWVGIERFHALHRYRADRRTHMATFEPTPAWPDNGGIEAIVEEFGDEPMLALIERRSLALAYIDGDWTEVPVEGGKGWPTGGARLGDGRIVILTRALGPSGFTNRIGLARWTGDKLVIGAMVALPLGWLDNMEGIATAPLPDGATRLWIISDDNSNWYQRTVLVAYDVQADAWP